MERLGLAPIATPTALPQPTEGPTATHFPTVVPTPSPSITPSPTPKPIDYAPMIGQIKAYVKTAGIGPKFDMSVGFVDIQTGQSADFDGQTRHLSLSTFKGPLGAYYFWLIEQGKLEPEDGDLDILQPMINVSDNGATSCVFERVGGLAGFNDWLAGEGLSRENNFVAQWQNWACTANRQTYILPPDPRYYKGDAELGLPGGYALTLCAPKKLQCFEAFAPVELARLYANLYQGKVLNAQDTQQWLALMKKHNSSVALVKDLTADQQAGVTGYVKNGFAAEGDVATVNFQHEAGIIVTPYGAYALAVFTQGDPDWPGNEPVGRAGKIVYDYFAIAHGAGGEGQ